MIARRTIAVALVAALVSPVAASPRKILVLKSDGRADAPTREKVDAAIIKLAKTTEGQISPGDITMTDAATALGCAPETTACREQILDMLSVDELVYASVTPKPGGAEVIGFRVARGGIVREAKSPVQGDKVDGLAPLFFASTTASLPPPTATTEPTPPPPVEPEPAPAPAPPIAPPPAVITPLVEPAMIERTQPPRHKLVLAGAITGGSMLALGFILWGKAASLQGKIDDMPTQTVSDFQRLHALENDADGYAGWGNVLFVTGAVIGGISAYYIIKSRKQSSTTAIIAPTVLPGGAGIALTFGGTP